MKNRVYFGSWRKVQAISNGTNFVQDTVWSIEALGKLGIGVSSNGSLPVRTETNVDKLAGAVRDMTTFLISIKLHFFLCLEEVTAKLGDELFPCLKPIVNSFYRGGATKILGNGRRFLAIGDVVWRKPGGRVD
jgi:hypothetical protein